MTDAEAIVAELKALGSEKDRAGMARFGIATDRAFGVSITAMRPIAKRLGRDQAAFDTAAPVADCYAKAVTLMGAPGAGQLTKMVNQICIAGLVQGLAEGLNFGTRAGLDMATVIDVISKGAAGSWQMENRAPTMCQGKYDFGFAVDWMRKDLGICLAEASRNGARLPVTALVDQFYAQVQARGGKRWDTSSLMHLLVND